MAGPEHYQEAERLIAEFQSVKHGGFVITPVALTLAQVHATLAAAAATALGVRGWPEVAGQRVPAGPLDLA